MIRPPISLSVFGCCRTGFLLEHRYCGRFRPVPSWSDSTRCCIRYSMAPSEVRNILTNIIFGVEDLEPTTVLKLWERETALRVLVP